MVLCVDVGNSFVKYALASGRRWVSLGKQRPESAAEGKWPAEVRRRASQLASVDGAIVSSVVPSVDRPLRGLFFHSSSLWIDRATSGSTGSARPPERRVTARTP